MSGCGAAAFYGENYDVRYLRPLTVSRQAKLVKPKVVLVDGKEIFKLPLWRIDKP